MDNSQIARLYHGLYGQATAFQQLTDELVGSPTGPSADVQLQLLAGFHQLTYRVGPKRAYY
eukprot:scaffold304033_cov27-Prasinocladus_malaysianus.AAC.1